MHLDLKRVQAIFGAAVESDSLADRAAVLDRECATDLELRTRVEALLGAHDEVSSLLDQPFVGHVEPGEPSPARPAEGGLERTVAASPIGDSKDLYFSVGPGAASDLTRAIGISLEASQRDIPVIAGYQILHELGRGGMGVVYLARQDRLNRPCVLKMILGGARAGSEATARFLAEAEAVARLQHPNVVRIHHIGEADGLPFFELEYVDGGSLDQRLDGGPWPAKRAATLIEALARGVAEAHRLGIVHRDLKPGNVLLAADDTPKVTDFGLAKSLAADSGLTRTDSIMGSPSYMAPEQAEGKAKEVGLLADVYALGAILYELLTGRPPFRGSTILATLEQVKTAEPVAPSRLVPGVPADIETIALKCLQKEQGKRYDSATALADDLRRFLGDEPIVARPVPFWERGWRWCRRHPAPAGLTAAVVVVTTFGLCGVLWQWGEAVQARNDAVRASDLASRRAVAEGKARQEAETTVVDMYATSGISAGDQGDFGRAALWFANAARRASGDPDRRLANIIRAQTWSRRAVSPIAAVVVDGSLPGGLDVHPGGRHMITKTVINDTSRDMSNTLWDLETERSIPFPGGHAHAPAAVWSPDGSALAVGGADGDVVVVRFPSGEGATRVKFPGRIRLLSFCADGRFLAIAGGNSARVWDVQSHVFATPELVHPAAVTTLAFHPIGRFLATGCADHQARVFAVPGETAVPKWPPVRHLHNAMGTIFFSEFCSPPLFVDGGRGVVTYGGSGSLTCRATDTGAEIRTFESTESSGRVVETDLSPDGRYLAVVSFQWPVVRIFEVATGRPVGPGLEHKNTVFSAAFSPDGRMLLTGSTDNTARLWSVPSGEPLARPLDLHRSINVVAFAPDGRSMATQDRELVRLWSLPKEGLATARLPLDGKGSFAAQSPDGVFTIATGMTFPPSRVLRSTRALHVATGRPAGPSLRPGGLIVDAAFSPDARSVATLSARDGQSPEGQDVVVWDWESGRRRWRAELPSEPRSLSFHPDGRRLAVLCGDGELLVFDAAAGREARRWQAHDPEPAHHWVNNGQVRFSPDGRSVLTWGMGNNVGVWDAETGRPRYAPLRHRDKCHDLQFSPDGRSMALAAYDGSVGVRDLATGAIVAELPAHPDIVYSARFSPDGRLLVTACRDRTVRVWDWRAGSLACPPFEHAKDAVAATFTPDGRWVLSVSVDGTARAWEWRTGKPVTPPLTFDGEPMSVAVTADGKYAVVGGDRAELAVLNLGALAPTDLDADTLCRWAELLSGQWLHERGGTVKLSAEEWIAHWREFRLRSARDGVEFRADSGETPTGSAVGAHSRLESIQPVRLDELAIRVEFADSLLRTGRVDDAIVLSRQLVPLFRRAVDQSPDDPSLRHRLALALVLAGDRDGYRNACAATLSHFSRLGDPLIGEAARACLVAPNAVDDFSVPRRLIEAALVADPGHAWLHYMLGLAHFRAGRYREAVDELQQSLDLGAAWLAAPLNYPVLAMAHSRLGNGDEARRWLRLARGPAVVGGVGAAIKSSAMWWDRVEFRLLLREADATVHDVAFPADPFAR
jgi:eukaryotic-like serine/threonine-protein kinase